MRAFEVKNPVSRLVDGQFRRTPSPSRMLLNEADVSAEEERRFFSDVILPNGVFKTTARNRMDDVNALVSQALKKFGSSPRAVLDIAASSGAGSVEWIEHLRGEGYSPSLTATDLYLNVSVNSYFLGFEALLASDRTPILYNLFGHSVRVRSIRRRDYFTGQAVAMNICKFLFRVLKDRPSWSMPTLLISPIAKHHADAFVESDVFGYDPEMVGRFDIIRAANILNYGYFNEKQLMSALENLRRYLRGTGALLVLNRTNAHGVNNGSVFRLDESGQLESVSHIGEGSEIATLVAAIS